MRGKISGGFLDSPRFPKLKQPQSNWGYIGQQMQIFGVHIKIVLWTRKTSETNGTFNAGSKKKQSIYRYLKIKLKTFQKHGNKICLYKSMHFHEIHVEGMGNHVCDTYAFIHLLKTGFCCVSPPALEFVAYFHLVARLVNISTSKWPEYGLFVAGCIS